MKGGRTSGTWASNSSWRSGKTTVIRVPQALAPKILDYARKLDAGEVESVDYLISRFMEIKRRRYRWSASTLAQIINTPTWLVFNEFCLWAANRSRK